MKTNLWKFIKFQNGNINFVYSRIFLFPGIYSIFSYKSSVNISTVESYKKAFSSPRFSDLLYGAVHNIIHHTIKCLIQGEACWIDAWNTLQENGRESWDSWKPCKIAILTHNKYLTTYKRISRNKARTSVSS